MLPYSFFFFLAATKQLYKWYFHSVRLSAPPSVCLSVWPSVLLSVTPFWLCSHHRIIMKFSGDITNDQSKVHAKGQGQRSKVKVTTQLNRFQTVTPVWIHIWWWNDAYCLMLLRRGALLFFKVICQVSMSHGSKNLRIWPRLGVSGLILQFEITNGYEMMHKAWGSIEEVSYCFSRSSVKFQRHTALKIIDFDPNWAFPDCNSSLKSPMATKWCTKLEIAWRGALLFCKVIHQIARSHGSKNSQFLPNLGVSRMLLHLEFTDGYEMVHRAGSSIVEVPYSFSRS